MENKLPKNWIETQISEIAVTSSGGTPSTTKKEYWDGNIPWINSGKLKDEDIFEPSRYITELGLKESSAKLFPVDTVVIALTGATTGKLGYLKLETTTNQSVTGIFPNKFYNSKLLFYQLRNLRNEILSKALGSAQPHINKKIVDDTLIKFPPLAEQNRIVAKLDALFAQLETIKASMARVPLLLKDFRQQVLDNEFKLNFEKLELKDICLKIQDGAHHSPKVTYDTQLENTFPYITSKNIRNNFMRLDNVQFVDLEFHNTIYPRCTPEFGDVLLTKDGANTGNVTLNELEVPFSLLSSVCLIKTDKKKLIPAYLKYYFQSNIGFNELIGEMTGTAIKRIVLKKIKATKIPTPTIEKQQEIVSRVESLFAKADAIEKQYETLKARIDSLPQAILHKAFKGELTEQLESDGDARELLQQIQMLQKKQQDKKEVKSKTTKATTKKVKSYAEKDGVLGMVAED